MILCRPRSTEVFYQNLSQFLEALIDTIDNSRSDEKKFFDKLQKGETDEQQRVDLDELFLAMEPLCQSALISVVQRKYRDSIFQFKDRVPRAPQLSLVHPESAKTLRSLEALNHDYFNKLRPLFHEANISPIPPRLIFSTGEGFCISKPRRANYIREYSPEDDKPASEEEQHAVINRKHKFFNNEKKLNRYYKMMTIEVPRWAPIELLYSTALAHEIAHFLLDIIHDAEADDLHRSWMGPNPTYFFRKAEKRIVAEKFGESIEDLTEEFYNLSYSIQISIVIGSEDIQRRLGIEFPEETEADAKTRKKKDNRKEATQQRDIEEKRKEANAASWKVACSYRDEYLADIIGSILLAGPAGVYSYAYRNILNIDTLLETHPPSYSRIILMHKMLDRMGFPIASGIVKQMIDDVAFVYLGSDSDQAMERILQCHNDWIRDYTDNVLQFIEKLYSYIEIGKAPKDVSYYFDRYKTEGEYITQWQDILKKIHSGNMPDEKTQPSDMINALWYSKVTPGTEQHEHISQIPWQIAICRWLEAIDFKGGD